MICISDCLLCVKSPQFVRLDVFQQTFENIQPQCPLRSQWSIQTMCQEAKCLSLHPRKTNGWIPKMKVWNIDLLSKEVIFRFKVSFRGSIFSCMEVLASSNPSVHGGASGAMMNYHQPPKKSSTFMGKNHPTLPYICCIV